MEEIFDIIDSEYEFKKKGIPTGHYARGVKVDTRDKQYAREHLLYLLCNGQQVWVDIKNLRLISTKG